MRDTLPFEPSDRQGCVLIVADRDSSRRELAAEVSRLGYEVHSSDDVESAARLLAHEELDVCLIETSRPGRDASALWERSMQWRQATQLIGLMPNPLLGNEEPEPHVDCEFIFHPCSPRRLSSRLKSAVDRIQILSENRRLRRCLRHRLHGDLVGYSPTAESLRDSIQQAADNDDPVLVWGEAGTGTTLVGQAIHLLSRRAHQPLIQVDCSLLTADSLQRELFGEKSHGTGRVGLQPAGRIERAAEGTLLLDNVGAVTLSLQKKLSALFTSRRSQQQTADRGCKAQTRVIAVSHGNLSRQTAEGLFRKELYEFFCRQTIHLSPLRERREDIGPLTEHFLHQLAVREGQRPRRLALDALKLLESYHWPGNIRELQIVIERACSLDCGSCLTAETLHCWLAAGTAIDRADPSLTLGSMERKLIETTFTRCRGNRQRTAQSLRIGLRTLSGKLREYGYPPRGGPGSNITAQHRKAA